jgi:hypothetical protein
MNTAVQRAEGRVQGALRSKVLRPVALGVALVLAGGCDSGPKAGEVVFNLTTPNLNDGAIQFRLTAAAPNTLDGVTAGCAGCQVFTEAVSETEIRGVLIGNVAPGQALRVLVSDRKARDAYTGQVVAVASRTYALGSTTGYSLAPAN